MKVFHVLPGDSLVETFKKTNIEGEITVCRECLVEGDLLSKNLNEFWRVRENYLNSVYPKTDNFYRESVKSEFEKLQSVSAGDEINLWFEYELFCQANMWFCLWLLNEKQTEIFRVAPVVRNEDELWKGFGCLEKDALEKCFEQRIKFSDRDVWLGAELWRAYRNKDFDALKALSRAASDSFPYLEQVCEAEIEKNERPKESLRKIISTDETNFNSIFQKFNEIEGVYGFGDLQVKRIYKEIVFEN